jgi:hypothetical protein
MYVNQILIRMLNDKALVSKMLVGFSTSMAAYLDAVRGRCIHNAT